MMHWIKVTEVSNPSACGCIYLARRKACALSAAAVVSEPNFPLLTVTLIFPFGFCRDFLTSVCDLQLYLL